jgi:hypothetical protein
MTHQVDAVAGAVRIFRTPFCRLPPSLSSISNPPTSGNTPPPAVPAMKIMRRGGDGDTGPSPSKATSETGSDSKDKGLSAKEKYVSFSYVAFCADLCRLSREEREAAYNAARERIFGKDDKTGDATPGKCPFCLSAPQRINVFLDTEDGHEMSRSSSVSTKDRSGKRGKPAKQRREDSDSFDVRSQYTPFFPQQAPTGPTWAPTPQYPTMMPQQFNGVAQNTYPNSMPPQFAPQSQSFNSAMINNGNMQTYSNMQQVMNIYYTTLKSNANPWQFPQPNQARFQPHSAPITTYGSPVQSPPLVPQQWQQQNIYQSSYQQPRGPMVTGPQNTIPYAFGQLPSTTNPADPKSQHPIPGSFNRHAFNPKTQSFVPGGSGLPVPQPLSHHGSPHHGSPHHGSPHQSYNLYTPPQPPFGSSMGYSMARQGSNSSLPSYHASPHMPHRPMLHQGMPPSIPHGIQNMVQVMPQGPHVQNMQNVPQSGQVGNHLPNYGNPATLPPKPPTGV